MNNEYNTSISKYSQASNENPQQQMLLAINHAMLLVILACSYVYFQQQVYKYRLVMKVLNTAAAARYAMLLVILACHFMSAAAMN